MIRQLHGWVENISKRQVKTPKIYFRDSGIFHTLLNASGEVYFWGTHNEAELDLDRLTVVHPGSGKFPLDKKIDAAGLDVI